LSTHEKMMSTRIGNLHLLPLGYCIGGKYHGWGGHPLVTGITHTTELVETNIGNLIFSLDDSFFYARHPTILYDS
jgi:hypothetical protein